jgi:hypothetical protein
MEAPVSLLWEGHFSLAAAFCSLVQGCADHEAGSWKLVLELRNQKRVQGLWSLLRLLPVSTWVWVKIIRKRQKWQKFGIKSMKECAVWTAAQTPWDTPEQRPHLWLDGAISVSLCGAGWLGLDVQRLLKKEYWPQQPWNSGGEKAPLHSIGTAVGEPWVTLLVKD